MFSSGRIRNFQRFEDRGNAALVDRIISRCVDIEKVGEPSASSDVSKIADSYSLGSITVGKAEIRVREP